MAARTMRTHHQDDVRAKIQATQIINRLTAYFNGEVELTYGQIAAAKILLSKSVPDLVKTELTGADGVPLEIKLVAYSDTLPIPTSTLPAPDPESTGLRH